MHPTYHKGLGVSSIFLPNINRPQPDLGFSVVVRSCATGSYSFGHELGHNRASHPRGDPPVAGVFPFSYGFKQSRGGAIVSHHHVLRVRLWLSADRLLVQSKCRVFRDCDWGAARCLRTGRQCLDLKSDGPGGGELPAAALRVAAKSVRAPAVAVLSPLQANVEPANFVKVAAGSRAQAAPFWRGPARIRTRTPTRPAIQREQLSRTAVSWPPASIIGALLIDVTNSHSYNVEPSALGRLAGPVPNGWVPRLEPGLAAFPVKAASSAGFRGETGNNFRSFSAFPSPRLYPSNSPRAGI